MKRKKCILSIFQKVNSNLRSFSFLCAHGTGELQWRQYHHAAISFWIQSAKSIFNIKWKSFFTKPQNPIRFHSLTHSFQLSFIHVYILAICGVCEMWMVCMHLRTYCAEGKEWSQRKKRKIFLFYFLRFILLCYVCCIKYIHNLISFFIIFISSLSSSHLSFK